MIKKLINDFKISKLLLIRIIFIIKLEKLDILPKNTLIDNIYSLNDLSRYIDENITHFSKLFSKDISYDFSDEIIESLLDLCNYDFDYNIFSEIYNMNLDVNFLKKDGIFYTPDAIVECILNNTVHNFKDDLKILDPSWGTGIFLIKCVDVLYPIYKDSDLISGFIYGVDLDENLLKYVKFPYF